LARGWQAGFNEARPVGGNLSAHGRYVSLVKKEPGSMAPAIAVLGLLRRGYLGTAMLIGLNIHLRQFETIVRSGDVCSSVCTMIWLAGKPRHLGRLAKLGFHSAAYPDTEMRNEEGNQTIAEYFKSIGVPQQVIDLQPMADPCCLNYVDYLQAKVWVLLKEKPTKQELQEVADRKVFG
jgi:hypothetical protein